jgi:hypothetical protein
MELTEQLFLEQVVEELQKVKIADDALPTDVEVHAKCPGHVVYENDPGTPCPNCK